MMIFGDIVQTRPAEQGSDQARVTFSLLELGRLAVHTAECVSGLVVEAGQIISSSLRRGGKVLVCGNGGSAADAQHFAAELIGRMCFERGPLPAISLSSDPSVVSALSNDYGYENVFARQVDGFGNPGDVLLAISTSGKSRNVVRALEAARRRGVETIALVGEGGDSSLDLARVLIRISSPSTQRIQELHMAILHAICEYVERKAVDDGVEGLLPTPKGGVYDE